MRCLIDDTVLVRVTSVENLLTIKAVFRSFEFASGLKVNFFKSCLFGVNVGKPFMDLEEKFLQRKVKPLPFKYLGLPVGKNPEKEKLEILWLVWSLCG